jgi:uncharacterized membrane protein YraQ (UPF0718 family)
MVAIVATYLRELLGLLGSLWLYFLIGFLLAGFIAEFVPARTLLRYLSRTTLLTLLKATVAGTAAYLLTSTLITVGFGLLIQRLFG